ncbi:hypothetical protein E5198_20860 [Pseudomonas sp. A-1]|uniref:hypothetical protein n=1 Tax=unclassified Pseudomonas TaxID=196821 RepID=UPI0010A5DFC5|nr:MULTISPECIES: hypothetical protein [unclassified Pseudomonas]THG70512.1 hypothetical protein E5198_20860 [Pseudomonas sp. A-1]
MDWISNKVRSLLHVRLVRFIFLEIVAMLASVFLVFAVGGFFASIAGYIYDSTHVMPDPVARGDDIGSGLIMVMAALGSLLFSLPGVVLVHLYVFKRFFEELKK